jgi:hypothetical protein
LAREEPSDQYILLIDVFSNNLVDLLFESKKVAKRLQRINERVGALQRDANGLKKQGSFKESCLDVEGLVETISIEKQRTK